jgi:hypothetical protein
MRAVSATFNYTDRVRIERERIKILATAVDGAGEIVVETFTHSDLLLPQDAVVIIECGSTRTGVTRHHLGSIGNLLFPIRFEYPVDRFEAMSILLKVVDVSPKSRGRILALCAGLKPEVANSSGSLLPVVPSDLGESIWHLEFDEETGPELQLNERIENRYQIYSDPEFRSLVLPEVVARIVVWTFENKSLSSETPLGEVVAGWKALIRNWGVDVDLIDGESVEVYQFATSASVEFAQRSRFATTYIDALGGDSE